MFSFVRSRAVVAGVAAAALLVAGCSSSKPADQPGQAKPDNTASAAPSSSAGADNQTKASLSDWDGSWASLASYVDHPELQKEFEKAAKEHGETVDEMKKEIKEKYGADFEGMVIGDDKITFVDKAADLDKAKAADGAQYTFVRGEKVKTEKFEFTWFIFEGDEKAKHKYLLLLPLHGEEELTHFHARFGNTIEEALKGRSDDWYPTFINPKEATNEQIAHELLEHDH